MPEAESAQLRLFCICGQKMRVSEAMFGKPGKCVACRQKIRIPRLDEFPADSTEMYLKDHPEFLRTPPKSRKKSAMDSSDSETEEVQILGDAPETVPLEDLPILRELCSYEYKIERKLRELGKGKKGESTSGAKASLMSYRNMVRKARTALNDTLRGALEQVRDQITAVEEEIARASLEVRTGKLAYLAYYSQVTELRHERERLVRLHHNLRAWMQTKNPFVAGGFQDLPLEEIPIDPPVYRVPQKEASEQLLVNLAVEALRSAMKQREEVARRKAEWDKMARSGSLIGAPLEHANAESDALRRRAAAQVGFVRGRLEQVVQDCESDSKALKAQLKLSQERLQDESLSRSAYQSLEMDLLRAQADNSKAHDLARRALNANTASDVPKMQGTFLLRLARPRESSGFGMDSLLAWGSMALMVVSILVPLLPDAPGGNLVLMPGLVMGLVALALLTGIAALIPVRALRAPLLNSVFFLGALGVIGYFYVTSHANTAAGAAMRISGRWYASPGMFMLLVAMALSAAACAASVVAVRRLWAAPLVSLGGPLLVLLVVGTNLGGLISIQPSIAPAELQLAVSELGPYNTTLEISNAGWREFLLADAEEPGGKTSLQLVVERRVGTNSWQDAGLPISMKLENTHWWDPFSENTFPAVKLPGGAVASFRFALLPGVYRVQLLERGAATGAAMKKGVFEVPESMAITDEMRLPRGEAQAAPEDVTGDDGQDAGAQAAPSEPVAQMALDGVISGEGRTPHFQISVSIPGSRPTSHYLQLGDQIHGNWIAQEYNPETQKLTVSNGRVLLVLGTGEQIDLVVPQKASGPAAPN